MSCDFQPISLIPAALQTQKFQVTRIKISPSGRPQPSLALSIPASTTLDIHQLLYVLTSNNHVGAHLAVYVVAVIEPQQLLTVQLEIPAP